MENRKRRVTAMQAGVTLRKQGLLLQCCFTSTETIRTIRDGESRTSTSTFTQLLSSVDSLTQCCFTSTETTRTIRDGEYMTSTSTFTQLLKSKVYPHRLQRQELSRCSHTFGGEAPLGQYSTDGKRMVSC